MSSGTIRKFVRLVAVALVAGNAAWAAGHATGETPRIVRSLDHDWTFQYFPASAPVTEWAKNGADDSMWPAVAVPHTWSVYETTHQLHPFIAHATEREDSYWWYGWGWYRKHLSIAKSHASKEVFLEFDGVQKVAFVYVNGHLVGEHRGGYTSFSFDVTRWIRFGEDNVIAVQVSNRRDDDLGRVPPMTAGNFDVYGGINRSVRLVLTSKVHIPFQGAADHEGGSFVLTPHVSRDTATVHDTTWVGNDGSKTAEIDLESRLMDADGKVLSTRVTHASIPAGQIRDVVQDFPALLQPHLWSPSTPYLYRIVSSVLSGGVAVDRHETPFGVRYFSWNHAEKRLYLNGAPIRLIGTNRHQDFPWLGDAMPVWLQLSDLHDMRYNMGYNFQRTAHYPQDPAVYRFCDENGIMIAEESPNIKDIAFGRDVQETMMREMVRRDRNHPSIVIWSIGNETDHPADSAWTWSEDQSRIINLRRGTNGGDHVMITDADLPLEQTLRCTVRGWYNDDAHSFAPENGEPASGQVTGTEEWQHTTDAEYLRHKKDENVVVFLYADHGADRIYRNAPLHYVNPKGWVDGLRFPKYVYYLWQANFTSAPMVFVHPWPWQQRYIGQKKTITIDSNADSVELFIDGRSLGVRRPSADNVHVVEFNGVPVTQGTLRAVGHKGGATVEQALAMPGAPQRLTLRVREAHLEADRGGLAVLDVAAVDANGTAVPYIHPVVTWTVTGEGHLVGPAVYKTDTNKNGAQTGTMYIDLPTANLIRTTGIAGAIEVTVSSPGLAPAKLTLHSGPVADEGEGVTQPALSDSGRLPVRHDSSVNTAAAAPPRVFEHITQDYQLPASTSGEARESLERFLHEHNPKLPTDDPGYADALNRLTALLVENHGNLIADWYNFTADQFEDVSLLRATVEASKAPRVFRDLLEQDYADRILLDGETLDAAQESKALAAAIGKGLVVSRQLPPPPGIEHSGAQTIGELAAATYPAWTSFSPQEQTRALQSLRRFNPLLRAQPIRADEALPDGPILMVDASMLLH